MSSNKHIAVIISLLMLFSTLLIPGEQYVADGGFLDGDEPPEEPPVTHTFGADPTNPAYKPEEYFYNSSSEEYEPIDYNIISKSLSISGRDYSYGITEGWYSAYFRDLSSDVKDRPVAMVSDNYTLTFSPVDFILLQPHKGTTQGKVGNRVQSNVVIDGNNAIYPEQYDKIGTSGSFANLTYEYQYR